MMNKLLRQSNLWLLCFFIKANIVTCQVNLVVDPSMEKYLSCPTATTGNEGCITWHSLDSINNTNHAVKSCSPIYINKCSTSTDNSCPANYAQGYSFMNPRTGNGMYANVFYCDPITCNSVYNRDYLRGRVLQLENGKKYCGKYYVSLYKSMKYAIDRFGAYLDDGTLDVNDECLPIIITPTFENPTLNYITDTIGWQKIQGIFTANGNEKYITIGNFYSHSNTNKIIFNASSMWNESYYYVDDVSLIPMDIKAFAGNDVTICASDTLNLGRPQEVGLECLWYTPSNSTPFSLNSNFTFKPTQTGTFTFIQKMDNCQISFDTVTVTVIEDCNSLIEIPNVFTPNNDNTNDTWHFQLKNATQISYTIYNRWGLEIKSSQIQTQNFVKWDGYTTAGEPCTAGVYFYILQYTDANREIQKKNGYITLVK